MKEQCYQYTTDLLVIGCGFSGMWAAMRARDFLGDVLVVDKGPRDWGGLGGLSGGDMIVKQPDMKLDDLLDDLVQEFDLYRVACLVVDLLAAPAALDQPALCKRTQMVRDGGARHFKQRRNVDDAFLPVAEQPENAHPRRVAQLLENIAHRAEMLHILQFPMQIFRVSMRTVVVRKRKLRHCPFLLVFPASVNAEKDAAQAASFLSCSE